MAERLAVRLPASLIAEREGAVAILRLNRPQKRNALNDEAIVGIEQFFSSLPDGIGAVLIRRRGRAFLCRPGSLRIGGARRHARHCAFQPLA
jgi:enoyl-CoA hydratase/carnithine racemase